MTVLVGLVTLRTRGPAFIISTIALLLMTGLLFDNCDLVGGSNGLSLPLPPFPVEVVKVPFYYVMLIIAFASVYLVEPGSSLQVRSRSACHRPGRDQGGGCRHRHPTDEGRRLQRVLCRSRRGDLGLFLERPTVFFIIRVAAQMVLMVIIGGRGTVATRRSGRSCS